jgi:hypothetical protein
MATCVYLSPSIPRPRSLVGSPKGVVSIAVRDLQGEQIVTLQCLSKPRGAIAHTNMHITCHLRPLAGECQEGILDDNETRTCTL